MIGQVDPLLQDAEDTVTEVEAGIDECNASDNPIICLGGLAFTEGPKIENIVEQIVPVISKIVQLENDVDSCLNGSLETLQGDVDTIIADVENCLGGGL